MPYLHTVNYSLMPIIHTLDSIKIYIYYFDHAPPHFHAQYNEYEELIDIQTLDTLAGSLPKKQHKKVIEWASDYQDLILEKWNEHNNPE